MLDPDVMKAVAEFGDSYIVYLYFRELMPIPICAGLLYGVYRIGLRFFKEMS